MGIRILKFSAEIYKLSNKRNEEKRLDEFNFLFELNEHQMTVSFAEI